ncbi:MAG TPA: RNA methyltransferase [Opitutaceae bacterium]
MLHVQPVADLELPALAPYRSLRYSPGQGASGVFVAEGPKVIARLLAHPRFTIVSMLATEAWRVEFWPALSARQEKIDVFVAPESLLQELVGFHLFNGVLVAARVPGATTLAQVLALTPTPRLFVAVDGLTNAENLGAIARSAAALGAQAIIVGETSAPPWLRRTVRSSMGALLDLQVLATENLVGVLHALQDAGMRCVAADPHEAVSIAATDLRGDTCIVFGSEGEGLRPAVRKACTSVAAIPMPAHVDSLNVACAATVFLYEAARQRHAPTLAVPNARPQILSPKGGG